MTATAHNKLPYSPAFQALLLKRGLYSTPSLRVLERSESGERKKPVFVLFHGDRGNTNTPSANGQYLANNTDIIHGLISTSGNAFSFPQNSAAKQAENWSLISSLVGCNTTNHTTTLSCMRTIPWPTLSLAACRIAPTPGGSPVRSTPPFYPIVDNETVFSPSTYLFLASAGKFTPLPYFHGHNDNEQGYYVIPVFAQGRNVTAEQAQKFLLE
ncbi:carboxylesteras protein [Pyrenophora teres f. maculata]|nr:carboxylesteras protein [Pyrenophora teres f. maculata]